MNFTVACSQPISFGLFAVNEGSLWKIDGIKYNDSAQESMIHMTECGTDVWIEIPQKLLAERFAIA